ncbi:PorT family protein [Parabacteroides sp. OttesenSCG-928-G07]|nr:PorT family protein [Parabacteroides sp. OttesenSCG-928-G07]
MKKIVLILIIALTVVATGHTQQSDFRKEFAMGISAGTTFSSVSFRPKVPQGMLMGLTGGVTFRWLTEKNLGLQAEINYTQQGWKEDFSESSDPSAGYKYSRTMNYVELPFLTHIYFGSDRARFFINLGPKIGYMLSESTSQNLNGAEPHTTNEQHDMPAEYKFDWGLCGGPGFELRTGIGSFLLEGRYYYALGNIYGRKKSDFFAMSSQQVIAVKLTYLIPLIK